MARIQTPPDITQLIANNPRRWVELLYASHAEREEILRLADSSKGYLHWTDFRYKRPYPEGVSREEGWGLVRFHRLNTAKKLPFTSITGKPMLVSLTDGLHAAARRIGAHRQLLLAGLPEQPHGQMPEVMETFGLKAMIDEAYYSAVIEGAVSTRREARQMIRTKQTPRNKSERMILNNYRAGRQMVEWAKQPMTPDRLCELQKILTEGTLDNPEDWGQFRTEAIYIHDEAEGEVVHTGPPAEELPDRMQQLCDFANREDLDDPLPTLVRACLLHYQLAYDHPFGDGNGRTARWLFLWRLLRCPEYWWVAMLSISRMTSQGRQDYYNSFRYAEADGFDTTYLVRHQLHSMEKEMERFALFLTRRRKIASYVRNQFQLNKDPNHRQLALIDRAFRVRDSVFTQPEHAAFHGVSQPTARQDLEDLVKMGMLERQKGRPVLYSLTDQLRGAGKAYRQQPS